MTTAAVVSSFNPAEGLLDTCRAVREQVDVVVVVDDGSTKDVSAVLGQCRAAGYEVLELGVNRGIAHALNRGIERALTGGADHVLTLDQDTVLSAGYLQRMFEHLALAQSLGLDRTILATSTINGEVAPFWHAERGLTLAFEPIQSGMLLPREVLEQVGLFEEELFIDCVETEFYLRARAQSVHFLITPGTDIEHGFGAPTTWVPPKPLRLVLGSGRGGFSFTEDAPFRHYYIARNRAIMYARYWRAEPLWCMVSVAKDVLSRGRAMLFGTERVARTYLTVRGFWGAARGERGKIPDGVLRRAAVLSRSRS
jgi:rhamnosyltransferase